MPTWQRGMENRWRTADARKIEITGHQATIWSTRAKRRVHTPMIVGDDTAMKGTQHPAPTRHANDLQKRRTALEVTAAVTLFSLFSNQYGAQYDCRPGGRTAASHAYSATRSSLSAGWSAGGPTPRNGFRLLREILRVGGASEGCAAQLPGHGVTIGSCAELDWSASVWRSASLTEIRNR